jgi:hypothetical protein
MVSSTNPMAVTTNEPGGRKWVVTKPVHSGSAAYCWCIPFDAEVGRIVEIALGAQNRMSLADLAGTEAGA